MKGKLRKYAYDCDWSERLDLDETGKIKSGGSFDGECTDGKLVE